jgi:hypothetical protein
MELRGMDALSQVRNVGNSVFVGRLPRRHGDIRELFKADLALEVYSSAETYCIIEFTNPEDAAQAVQMLNEYPMTTDTSFTRLIAIPASQLTRLFIGGISKLADARLVDRTLRAAVKVRASPRPKMARLPSGMPPFPFDGSPHFPLAPPSPPHFPPLATGHFLC